MIIVCIVNVIPAYCQCIVSLLAGSYQCITRLFPDLTIITSVLPVRFLPVYNQPITTHDNSLAII